VLGQHVICGLKKCGLQKMFGLKKYMGSIVWAENCMACNRKKYKKSKMNNGPASNGPKNICGP